MLDDIRVLSLSPGRIRLKVHKLKHSHELVATLQRRITILPGVERLEINPTTCSLLLLYDKHLFARDESVRALQQALAGQLSDEERERLRAALAAGEQQRAQLQEALTGLLSTREQERLQGMLHSLAGQDAVLPQ